MIRSKELRLDNWLNVKVDTDGTMLPYRVSGLLPPDDGRIYFEGMLNLAINPEEDCEGIPLTREVLYSVPFETLSVGSRDTSYWQPYKPDIDFTLTWYVSDGRIEWEGRTIQFVHELQNIYLDITKDELNVDLSYDYH